MGAALEMRRHLPAAHGRLGPAHPGLPVLPPNGVPKVVCQEKHMGSRAVAVVCQDEGVAAKRFGIEGHGIGALYTRTGRPFVGDPALESSFLDRLRAALTSADFWKSSNRTGSVLTRNSCHGLQRLRSCCGPSTRQLEPRAEPACPPLWRLFDSRPPGLWIRRSLRGPSECVKSMWTPIDATAGRFPASTISSLRRSTCSHPRGCSCRPGSYLAHEYTCELCDADSRMLYKTAFKIVDLTSTESQTDGIAWWERSHQKWWRGHVCQAHPDGSRGKKGLINLQ